MNNVIIYGLISVLPLIVGSALGSYFNIKQKVVGFISAFGAGAMIAVLAFGLMEESFKLGGLDHSMIGFVVGGLLFTIGDLIIIKIGGRGHKKYYDVESSTGWGIVLGATLDGIPESIALGIGLALNPTLGLLVLVGIFLSNLPEGISSAYDLKNIKKTPREVMLIWIGVSVISFIFVVLGFSLFANALPSYTALFESIAAGAILAMLASTMMPEAYKESGAGVSMATILGFLVIFLISKAGV